MESQNTARVSKYNLIDGDNFLFAYHTTGEIDAKFLELYSKFPEHRFAVFIGSSDNFRKKFAVSKPYKGQRPDKPEHYYTNRAHLIRRGAFTVKGCEVDDVLAVLGTRYPESIVSTADKDLYGVNGLTIFNLKTRVLTKVENKIETVRIPTIKTNSWNIPETVYIEKTVFLGDYFLLLQMLTGDSADNISGVPQIGIKGATKLLRNCTTLTEGWEIVYNEYIKYYGAKAREAFFENYMLLKIMSTNDRIRF